MRADLLESGRCADRKSKVDLVGRREIKEKTRDHFGRKRQ
jgi:hypothetical protein